MSVEGWSLYNGGLGVHVLSSVVFLCNRKISNNGSIEMCLLCYYTTHISLT